MDTLKKLYNSFILVSVVEIAVGVFFFLKPAFVQNTISYIIGGLLIAFGVIDLIAYFKDEPLYSTAFKAIIFCCAGIFIIIRPDFIFCIIAVFFGIYLLIDGIAGLRGTSLMKARENDNKWIASLVFALLTLILGLLILINPFAASSLPFRIFGIALIASGILNIYNGGITKRYFKQAIKQAQLEDKEYIDIQ